jgi:hypothetical protein
MQGDGKPGWVQPTDEAVLHASQALVALVAAHLPQRFYREHPWRMAGAAMIVRMSDTVESMMALMSGRYAIDTLILLRALYEQVVMYCWISIDRDSNRERWLSNAYWHLRRLHNDALAFGAGTLSDEQLEVTASAKRLIPLTQIAAEVDEHWGGRLIGFRRPQTEPADILTLTGSP